ncbi:hypothetical protein DL96DRAFT_1718712 [Flagelloscypha sp. PMI_526]|nr:hypothetical protein DL96DRAFT_1718712 [Flagelloscypha sp. PMI_526]
MAIGQATFSSATPDLPDIPMNCLSPPTQPPAPPAAASTTRSGRQIIKPRRFQDQMPEPAPKVIAKTPHRPEPTIQRVTLFLRDRLTTSTNRFGLWQSYLYRPSYDPDTLLSFEELSNRFPVPEISTSQEPNDDSTPSEPSLYSSFSSTLLMDWLNNGITSKSGSEIDKLVSEVLLHTDFNVEELQGFKVAKEERFAEVQKTQNTDSSSSEFLRDFQEASIMIEVPTGTPSTSPQTFVVPGLFYRSIINTIQIAFRSPLADHFHYAPFTLNHQAEPNHTNFHRVYSEVYNSDVFIKEHDDLQRHGEEPEDAPDEERGLEKVPLALMVWSDATLLANFGSAKLWPIYLAFGNLSKYFRCRPNSGAFHHLAYIPSLPDSFNSFMATHHAKWSTQSKSILTHCRRDLFHAVWKFLLNDEFVKAHRYGIVIHCSDGQLQRFYPCLFTYSADYPEKVLLATIHDQGTCLCPRCMIQTVKVELMGQLRDLRARLQSTRNYLAWQVNRAREWIYREGLGIKAASVEGLLKDSSSVPTVNAFVDCLGEDYPLHRMLVVDFMHEFELGVWKAVFTHLIHILYAQPNGELLIAELDRRFRAIPRFGKDTIRRFLSNTSEMKNMAAHDFEDILQCSIPVFEGLLQYEHDNRILKLLFRLAEWHTFAKMHLHTEATLAHLETLTTELGRSMQEFRDTTCSAFETFETPREVSKKYRQKANQAKKGGLAAPTPLERKQVTLNLSTYKWHSLGDYVTTIRLFGPTDGYSTQPGKSEHRLVKRLYGVTNKQRATKQIAHKLVCVEAARQKALCKAKARSTSSRHPHQVGSDIHDSLENESISEHYNISKSKRFHFDLSTFQQITHQGDPAVKDFNRKLSVHLLGHLTQRDFDADMHDDFLHEDLASLRIRNDKIFFSKHLRVNYTTYDIQRTSDTINPCTQPFVMVYAPDSQKHPYWHAQVLGIFRAQVFRSCKDPSQDVPIRWMDFLWVRWLSDEPEYQFGFRRAKLPKIGFVPESDPDALGFLDPSLVIRGAHLLPCFISGRTNDLLSTTEPTAARSPGETNDWTNYYVNIFADRDMVMHHFSGGVGHTLRVVGIEGEDIPEGERQFEGEDVNEEDYHFPIGSQIESIDQVPNMNEDSEEDSEDGSNIGSDSEEDEEIYSGSERDCEDVDEAEEEDEDNGYAEL